MFVMLCNKWSMKRNGHLTFQYAIDCWGMHSDEGMPGDILSSNVVATCRFSSHNHVASRSKNKYFKHD